MINTQKIIKSDENSKLNAPKMASALFVENYKDKPISNPTYKTNEKIFHGYESNKKFMNTHT